MPLNAGFAVHKPVHTTFTHSYFDNGSSHPHIPPNIGMTKFIWVYDISYRKKARLESCSSRTECGIDVEGIDDDHIDIKEAERSNSKEYIPELDDDERADISSIAKDYNSEDDDERADNILASPKTTIARTMTL